MERFMTGRRRAGLVSLVAGLVALAAPSGAGAQIVISEVYPGGGNMGATYNADFIELINKGGAANVNGYSVETFSASGMVTSTNPLSGTIPAHGYLLVQLNS